MRESPEEKAKKEVSEVLPFSKSYARDMLAKGEVAKAWIVESVDSHRKYLVVKYMDGRYACNCPHFFYRLRGTGKECKHIRYVKEYHPIPFYDRERDGFTFYLKNLGEKDIVNKVMGYVGNAKEMMEVIESMEDVEELMLDEEIGDSIMVRDDEEEEEEEEEEDFVLDF